jgi:hypothetical protein
MKSSVSLLIALLATRLASALALPAAPHRLRRLEDVDRVLADVNLEDDWDDGQSCEVEEIQLASDGMLARGGLSVGEQVAPNMTVNGTVAGDEYRFFHMCIVRHEHEHAVTIELRVLTPSHGDANLYLSSEHRHPRVGRSTWIAQRVGDDRVRLPTYLDGFPRKSDAASRSIPLHIGVRGMSDDPVSFELAVAVEDLPTSSDVLARERYYSQVHRQDRQRQRLRGQ